MKHLCLTFTSSVSFDKNFCRNKNSTTYPQKCGNNNLAAITSPHWSHSILAAANIVVTMRARMSQVTADCAPAPSTTANSENTIWQNRTNLFRRIHGTVLSRAPLLVIQPLSPLSGRVDRFVHIFIQLVHRPNGTTMFMQGASKGCLKTQRKYVDSETQPENRPFFRRLLPP
jgi:hypothetical protein